MAQHEGSADEELNRATLRILKLENTNEALQQENKKLLQEGGTSVRETSLVARLAWAESRIQELLNEKKGVTTKLTRSKDGTRTKGAWICTNCGQVERQEREVTCWMCGQGAMVFHIQVKSENYIHDLETRHEFMRTSMKQISMMSSTTKLRKLALAALEGPPTRHTKPVVEEAPDSCTVVEDADIIVGEDDCA